LLAVPGSAGHNGLGSGVRANWARLERGGSANGRRIQLPARLFPFMTGRPVQYIALLLLPYIRPPSAAGLIAVANPPQDNTQLATRAGASLPWVFTYPETTM